MRLICPFTHIEPRTLDGIRATGRDCTYRDVWASDDAYWRLLAEMWEACDTFAVVEHDVIVRPDSLDELERCAGDWCAFGVSYGDGGHAGLGCAKFTAGITGRHRDALEQIGRRSDSTHPPRHWCRVDGWLDEYLRARGERKCVHGPPLEHVRAYDGPAQPSHGCTRFG